MASILRGNDLRQLGFPEGRAIGLALAQLQRKEFKRLTQAEQVELFKTILSNPAKFLADLAWSHTAAALLPPRRGTLSWWRASPTPPSGPSTSRPGRCTRWKRL
ncbi:MAG: hypothetical protein WKG07_42125 [Hymenobacter sp.]